MEGYEDSRQSYSKDKEILEDLNVESDENINPFRNSHLNNRNSEISNQTLGSKGLQSFKDEK